MLVTRRLLAPLLRGSTYRRWAYLILGGALLVPYLILTSIAAPTVLPWGLDMTGSLVVGGGLTLAALFASSLIPAVRVLEGAAIRELLDDPVPGAGHGAATNWSSRLRSSAMFGLHTITGGVIGLLSVLVPVLFVLSFSAPVRGRVVIGLTVWHVPEGWASAWIPGLFLLALLGLLYLVAGTGALLGRAAVVLLTPPPAERIAELERRTEQLAERNRLARELHDSVGHALSVVTLQAGAARRTLRGDPAVAETALLAIEESARAALDDLDHVLGLLREEAAGKQAAGKAPQADLAQLPDLIAATRTAGAAVSAELSGDFAEVPPVVSREAYRILQECLTNALRHAGKVPVSLRVAVLAGRLELTVGNPVDPGAAGAGSGSRGGRGLRGMTERVELLRGELSVGRSGDHWEVDVRLPWGARA